MDEKNYEDEQPEPAPDSSQTEQTNPFKRGVMQFEDYNYRLYNPYILVDKDKKAKNLQIKKITERDPLKFQEIDEADFADYEHSALKSPRMSPKNIAQRLDEQKEAEK